MQKRRDNLLECAEQLACDTVVCLEPENLFYVTGFWGEGAAILNKHGTTVIAPELEAVRAKEEAHDCNVVATERGAGLISTIASKLKGSRPCTDCLNYQTMQALAQMVPSIKQSTEPFYKARQVKDESEISILKQASKIIDEMFELCTNKIRKGMSEAELQGILMSYAIQRQVFSTGYRFTLNPLIIAGGSNGALPHAQVTNRKFAGGDFIVVDLTLRYKGYISDATRTFSLGQASKQAKEVYEVVKESQKLGLAAVRPMVSAKSVDQACRNYINGKNFGQYFIHSTGHGIGLEVHEPPTLSQKSDAILEKNMAVTVEPGIYIPKKFGVRIEDSLIVDTTPKVLHKFPKELISV